MKIAVICIVALLLIAAVEASKKHEKGHKYRDAFTKWMHDNNKQYASEEFGLRFKHFQKNMDFVEKWNSNPENTHQVGLNIFADISNEEYREIYLSNKFDATKRSLGDAIAPLIHTAPSDDSEVLASVDWVTAGAVTGVKNQGQCGSCWSFSTTGSVEGVHEISSGKLVALSEQQLMDCSSKYGNDGCNGGLMTDAFQYIIANKGIDTEASYPYKGVVGTCKASEGVVGASISSYKTVTAGSESALQTAAGLNPVSVAIDASHTSFQLYTSGVYYESACSSTQLDHGVLVVGYGATSSGTAYWLVKNSWGTSWGEAGYIQMSRDRNNNCGIATMASYPVA